MTFEQWKEYLEEGGCFHHDDIFDILDDWEKERKEKCKGNNMKLQVWYSNFTTEKYSSFKEAEEAILNYSAESDFRITVDRVENLDTEDLYFCEWSVKIYKC